ncbi:MAG: DUF441 domain-containing protein [Firmicutes bacterium]|nr:DUF441 domain-containing protein [Bacillota bacterium]
MRGEILLVGLLMVGLLSRSNLIATAACVLLILKLSNLDFVLPLLEKRGLELGLLFLLLSILVPMASGKITEKDLVYNLTSLPGIMAIIGGALATHLNQQGLRLMQIDPEIIFGLVLGCIIGIVFFNGQPVGPLMAAGVAALFLELFSYFK